MLTYPKIIASIVDADERSSDTTAGTVLIGVLSIIDHHLETIQKTGTPEPDLVNDILSYVAEIYVDEDFFTEWASRK
ncbi:hypothetical protein [Herbiconiux solani]|uniref:hypothetical protein n=1 Tax=Herbiconiux solani TaxID=661329 RepID=UPI000826522F|nr:hypothetical protein [Herbiconiux solani]